MKVIMLRPSYYPEISGGTHLAVDLVEDIVKHGIEIELIVPASYRKNKNHHQVLPSYEEQFDGKLKIHRVNVDFPESNIFYRAVRMLLLTNKMMNVAYKVKDSNLIISHSMPPFLGPICVFIGKVRRIPVLYWEQDILSESLITTGVASRGIKKKVLFNIAKRLEKISSKGSTHIITISNLFVRRQLKMGKHENDVTCVYNWIDTSELYPVERDDNKLFDEFNLDKKNFFVTYCGNLGIPQNVEILVEAAKKLESIQDLEVVIFGDGVRKEQIKEYINQNKVKNVKLFPLQPLEDAKYVYSLGDVGIVIGKKGTARNGFPSKTWSIMAAGQAMISCFDLDSELSEFVRDGKCGISIEPDNADQLAEAILTLYNNKEQTKKYGANSRIYVDKYFSRDAATQKFIEIIQKIVR